MYTIVRLCTDVCAYARTHAHIKESIQSLAIIDTERFRHAEMPINIGDYPCASASNPCQAYISSGSIP